MMRFHAAVFFSLHARFGFAAETHVAVITIARTSYRINF